MKWLLRVALAMVIMAELNSLWIAFTNRETYLKVFPEATGALFILTVLASSAAALNAVMLWVGKRWAIPLNVLIGVASIVLIELARGPISNQLIVLAACAVTTALAAEGRRRGRDSTPLAASQRLADAWLNRPRRHE